MTAFSPTHSYGTQTQRGVAERLLKGIRTAECGKRIGNGGASAEPAPARR
jgi:hypothetical protein